MGIEFQVGSFKYRVFRNSIGFLVWSKIGSDETVSVDWTLDGEEESPRFRKKLREAIGKIPKGLIPIGIPDGCGCP